MGKHSPVATVPRYMEQFRCAGGSCPENCCTGWTVAIDKASYQKYREVRQEPLAVHAPVVRAFLPQAHPEGGV